MKTTILIATLFLFFVSSYSQDLSKKDQKKLFKQFKKEQKAEELASKAQLVHHMVIHKQFVLEADQLRDRRGNLAQVSSMINFVAVDSIHGVIQVGSNYYVGMNGVGGITVEGPVSNYEFKYNEKNGSHNINFNIRSYSGAYDVSMIVSADGRTTATISSSWPGRLSYIGTLVPPAISRVYKGTSY